MQAQPPKLPTVSETDQEPDEISQVTHTRKKVATQLPFVELDYAESCPGRDDLTAILRPNTGGFSAHIECSDLKGEISCAKKEGDICRIQNGGFTVDGHKIDPKKRRSIVVARVSRPI